MHNNGSINRFHGVRRRQIIIRDSECRDRWIKNIMMVNRTRVGRNWLCPARDNHRFAKASLRISRLLQVSREVFWSTSRKYHGDDNRQAKVGRSSAMPRDCAGFH